MSGGGGGAMSGGAGSMVGCNLGRGRRESPFIPAANRVMPQLPSAPSHQKFPAR
jgi:hypothetical protein